MRKLNKALKQFILEKIFFADSPKVNIRLIYIPDVNKYSVSVFFTDNTIINLMKAQIIL
jgi:hypothetical protein